MLSIELMLMGDDSEGVPTTQQTLTSPRFWIPFGLLRVGCVAVARVVVRRVSVAPARRS